MPGETSTLNWKPTKLVLFHFIVQISVVHYTKKCQDTLEFLLQEVMFLLHGVLVLIYQLLQNKDK